jgi:hypothetical protein
VLIHDAHRVLLYSSTLGVPSAAHALGVSAMSVAVFLFGAAVFRHRSRFFSQEY